MIGVYAAPGRKASTYHLDQLCSGLDAYYRSNPDDPAPEITVQEIIHRKLRACRLCVLVEVGS